MWVKRYEIRHNPKAHWQWEGRIYYDTKRRWFTPPGYEHSVVGHSREEVEKSLKEYIDHLQHDKWTVVEQVKLP